MKFFKRWTALDAGGRGGIDNLTGFSDCRMLHVHPPQTKPVL